MSKRVLIAFDFDHTIIDDNSDTYIQRLAPNDGKIPDGISKLYSDKGWTTYMAEVFKYLHKNGTTPPQLLECVAEIPMVSGMSDLLNFITVEQKIGVQEVNVNFDAIIISDANSVFINRILKQTGVDGCFKAIYTNPASFDADGCLTIQPYHHQDWCSLSSVNMCKGHILDTHRSNGVQQQDQVPSGYDLVIFVGDGSNDLCPSLRLTSSDLVFARHGYSLAKRLAASDGSQKPVAKVFLWQTGLDILGALQDELVKLL